MVQSFEYNDVLEHVDLNNILLANKNWGTLTGLTVSERGAGANKSVDVASGSCFVDTKTYTEPSTTNIVIADADVTNPRKDLIIYDVSLEIPAVVTGIAATTAQPPDIPTGDILLALVDVPANASSIIDANITDKKIIVYPMYYTLAVSNVLLTSSDVPGWTGSSTYVKVKEVAPIPAATSGSTNTLRIKFGLSRVSIGSGFGRIYRNGVAVGTVQTATTSWVTHTEDISGWSAGDTLEVWAYGTSSTTVSVEELRIYGTHTTAFPSPPSW